LPIIRPTGTFSPAAEVWPQLFDLGKFDRHGFPFRNLDKRHRVRYWKLVSEHSPVVHAAVTGLSALPGTAKPFAATRAMSRFVNHEDIPFDALIEPAQDAVRSALAERPGRFVLVVHDRVHVQLQLPQVEARPLRPLARRRPGL
jgi:hypothetical protein